MFIKGISKKKIRVNIINPGFIKTSYFKSFAKKKLYNWTYLKYLMENGEIQKIFLNLLFFYYQKNQNILMVKR